LSRSGQKVDRDLTQPQPEQGKAVDGVQHSQGTWAQMAKSGWTSSMCACNNDVTEARHGAVMMTNSPIIVIVINGWLEF
jgi:hypothetical protein